jgi:hypothetical protein
MRKLRMSLALVVAVAGIVAMGACGDDDTEEETRKGTGGGGGDSGGALDTGVVAADDASTVEASTLDGGTGCFSFASGPNGFALAGGAQHQAGTGLVLTMTAGAYATATRAFQTSKPIATSKVTIDVSTQRDNGTWGTTANDLVQVFSQHYGASSSETGSATARLVMSGNAFELNVWHAANQLEGNHPLSATALNNGTSALAIATTWGTTGKVDVTIDNVNRTVNGNTLSSATGDTLTVVVGGRANGTVPAYTLTITKVCVELQ